MSTDLTIAAPKVLLMGAAGTGKTHSVGTLVDALEGTGEVFYLSLESGLESVVRYYREFRKKPLPANFHYHTIGASKKSFLDLKDNAEKVLKWDQKTLASWSDPKRHLHSTHSQLIEAMCDFPDDRTPGKRFGLVNDWLPDRWLVLDGLTGLGQACMSAVVGGKPMRSQPDWGLAQDQVESFLRMACDQCRCGFVLIAHISKEIDTVLGVMTITVDTLGQKLAPKLPAMFSDVIWAKREGTSWTWDTSAGNADIKARNLPWAKDQRPDFKTIVDSWRKNVAAIAAAEPGVGTPALPSA